MELLINGKSGFLTPLKKNMRDIGIHRFTEDMFLLKQLSKHVLEIMRYIKDHPDLEDLLP